jgi:hypothetical protein
VSRPVLTIFTLDRAALAAFTAELRGLLTRDDRSGLSSLLGLGEELSKRVTAANRAIDLMLRPEEDPEVLPLFASLRRVAKRAALEHVWTSDAPSLEGRLRAYDVLRDDEEIAKKLDRLLDVGNLPWFLWRPGTTGGWLEDGPRAELAERMQALGPSLPDEVNAFVDALGAMDGDVLVHDRL